jgi:hypothetical protein
MINGLGILGWGVGGIEAEAAMLGQPITMLIPQRSFLLGLPLFLIVATLWWQAVTGEDRARARRHLARRQRSNSRCGRRHRECQCGAVPPACAANM